MRRFLRNVIAAAVGMAVASLWMWLTGILDECSFAPKVVAYRPGMTVCPGQTVKFPPIIIPMPAPETLPGRPV